jgi:hypothetical protein
MAILLGITPPELTRLISSSWSPFRKSKSVVAAGIHCKQKSRPLVQSNRSLGVQRVIPLPIPAPPVGKLPAKENVPPTLRRNTRTESRPQIAGALWRSGADIESLVKFMRERGFSQAQSTEALERVTRFEAINA